MSILNNTRTYLIGHMEFADGQDWRKKATEELSQIGVTTFDPYHKPFLNAAEEGPEERKQLQHWMKVTREYDKVAANMKEIRIFDLRLCDISDFLIAHIIPSVASWGSAEEIYWSNRMKKPIFVSVEGGKERTPLWLMGTIPHKYIYNSVDEIIDMLKKINSGEVAIDSPRWRLLKPEYR